MCVCVCVRARTRVSVYALKIVSKDKILRFTNTLIIIIIHSFFHSLAHFVLTSQFAGPSKARIFTYSVHMPSQFAGPSKARICTYSVHKPSPGIKSLTSSPPYERRKKEKRVRKSEEKTLLGTSINARCVLLWTTFYLQRSSSRYRLQPVQLLLIGAPSRGQKRHSSQPTKGCNSTAQYYFYIFFSPSFKT